MTVGDLRTALANLDAEATVMLAGNGMFVHSSGVTAPPGIPLVVIRAQAKVSERRRNTREEDGVIRHLLGSGLSDDLIAEIMGLPAQSIGRKRKSMQSA